MAASAARVLALLCMAVGVVMGESGCGCEAPCEQLVADLRRQIARLQAEVHALRKGSRRMTTAARGAEVLEPANSSKVTAAARRAMAQEPAECSGDHYPDTDADMEALQGCLTVGTITMFGSRVRSLASLRSLQSAEKIRIDFTKLRSLAGLENLTSLGELELIGQDWIVSLSGLDNLRTLRVLKMDSLWELRSLDGLGSLVSVEYISITACDELESLSGLKGLKTAREIHIHENWGLQHLGLESLTSVNTLTLRGNDDLKSLAGLEGLRTVGQLEVSAGPLVEGCIIRCSVPLDLGLDNLTGLQNLEAVTSELRISRQYNLVSLTGLEKLRFVGGALMLDHLSKLASLGPLERLTRAGMIRITACSALRSLHGLGALESTAQLAVTNAEGGDANLRFLGGALAAAAQVEVVVIDEASWPLCITPHERDALASRVGATNLSSLPDATWQRWDKLCPNGTHVDVVCTKGQPCDFSLAGAGEGEERIFLSGRTTGCGTCPQNHLVGDVQEDGRVYLGCNLTDEEAGMRSICRCSADPELLGPVGQLLLRGPRRSALTPCARGHSCVLKLDGDALEPIDSLVVTSSCDAENPLLRFRATWSAENEYLLDDPATWYAAPPNRYEVCWRAPNSQCAPENGHYFVGEVELYGPYASSHVVELGEHNLSVPNIGFGTANGDRMRLRRGACGEVNEDSAHTLEAQSSRMAFDFGLLAEPRVQGGVHHLCWCQSRNGVNCTAEEHFMAESGLVEIQCPAAQQLVNASRCERCPAGTMQSQRSLSPCAQCPAGRYSLGSDQCTECPQGTAAERPGSSACVACPAWASADADAAGCSVDPQSVVLLSLFLGCVGVFCAMLVHSVRRRLPVVDVSLVQGHTIVTTLGPHGLSNFGRSSFPATLLGTGHPGLDAPSEPFRVRVKDAARLELVTWHGRSMDDRFDTSKGMLVVTFPHDLGHQGWPVPIVLSLPTLLVAIVGLGVVLRNAAALAFLGAAAAAVACTAASALVRWRPRSTSLERRLLEFKANLRRQHVRSSSCPKGPDRAVTVGQLHDLLDFFRDFIQDRTAYYLNTNVTTPLTKASRLSYAELVGPGSVEWFVSHFWGTAFRDFCTALRKHSETICDGRGWTGTRYWVCFCSNNQHRIEEEVGQGWEESSFYLTLKSGRCQGTCMVLDDQALPMTRIWCIFELLQTFKLQHSSPEVFTGLLLCTSSGVLNSGSGSVEVAMSLAQKVAGMDLSTAQASVAKDAAMIQQQVVREMGSYEALNNFVRREVYSMLVKAKLSANQQFAAVLENLGTAMVNL